jgi:mycothiol synthase
MEGTCLTPVVAADAAAVTEVVVALESSLYGQSGFSQADLEDEWLDLDLERNGRVVRDGDRIVGYGVVRARGDLWRADGSVHPDVLGRGIGRLIATGLEEVAARRGARRIQNGVFEVDSAARRLLESLGYTAVRVFREMRIELDAPPPAPEWPVGLRVVPFDSERDALKFHAAHQEAFADAWDYTPEDFESWSKSYLGSERFDPTLWCVVRAGNEIVAGTICTGTRTAAGSSTRSSRGARGASKAWARHSSATRSGASGSAASTASVSASMRRAPPALSVSTSAPGWRPCSAGWCTRRNSSMLRELHAEDSSCRLVPSDSAPQRRAAFACTLVMRKPDLARTRTGSQG